MAAAGQAGAEAVHPGYGFLAENAGFAQAVLDAGLAWIGPPPAVIRALGDKAAARAIAARAGAPLLPGTNRPVAGPAEAVRFAEEHGLPIAIKAVHGGGGRGLRVAREAGEVASLFDAACGRGPGRVRPRRVPRRGLRRARQARRGADPGGRARGRPGGGDPRLHPAAALPETRRGGTRAVPHRAPSVPPWNGRPRPSAGQAGYVSAGTVEFLLSPRGELSFLEVNTRLQVEHTVTEESADVDLVRAQLLIAAGHPLAVAAGTSAAPRRHAIEFRINAEDPARDFAPSAGPITRFRPPAGPGIRVDAGVEAGSVVGGQFDSLLAKLIVTGRDRPQAIERARRALHEFDIAGVHTTLPFLRAVLAEPAFTAEDPGGFAVHTRWIEQDYRPAPDDAG